MDQLRLVMRPMGFTKKANSIWCSAPHERYYTVVKFRFRCYIKFHHIRQNNTISSIQNNTLPTFSLLVTMHTWLGPLTSKLTKDSVPTKTRPTLLKGVVVVCENYTILPSERNSVRSLGKLNRVTSTHINLSPPLLYMPKKLKLSKHAKYAVNDTTW